MEYDLRCLIFALCEDDVLFFLKPIQDRNESLDFFWSERKEVDFPPDLATFK